MEKLSKMMKKMKKGKMMDSDMGGEMEKDSMAEKKREILKKYAKK